ncbi:sensor histidine kinase [Roseomonas sp. USHLN139]|uniref:sensor histidine kinase n=1 Tax=Roseomonas sp. USHLN139 TaxID=3081298 RepID=UPI003B0261E5
MAPRPDALSAAHRPPWRGSLLLALPAAAAFLLALGLARLQAPGAAAVAGLAALLTLAVALPLAWCLARARRELAASEQRYRSLLAQSGIALREQDLARLRAQQAARAAEQAQAELAHVARVATLGELSASIAHEINQPLAALTFNGDAALRWLARDPPALGEVRDCLAAIVAEAQRAKTIVQRLRGMAGRHAPERAWLDLNRVVAEAAGLLRRELAEQEVALDLYLAPGPLPLLADRVQIQQVVVNLLVNAMQASRGMPGPQRVVLSTERGEEIGFRVADRGVGLSETALPDLFRAFYTTRPEGMGMGLSICRTIVEAHDGRIAGAPREGGGAVFSVTFPARQATAAAPPAVLQPAAE